MAPNSPDLNPLGYLSRLGCHAVAQLLKTIDELRVALQTIWEELPQERINKAVANFTKRWTACVAANGRSLPASVVTLFISKAASSSQHHETGSFQSHPHTCYRIKINVRNAANRKNNNFPKVVQQHYVAEAGKSITSVLHLFSIYSAPNIV